MANASFSTGVCESRAADRRAKAEKHIQREERGDVCQTLTRGLTPGPRTA